MKKIECFIRPEKLPLVEQALRNERVGGMTVTEVKGFGRQYHPLTTKMKVEVYVTEVEVDRVLRAIEMAAYSGRMGDGKMSVLPVEDMIRIRTNEHGAQAVW